MLNVTLKQKRFISKDTGYYTNLLQPETFNQYTYTGNDPVNYVDYGVHERNRDS